MFVFLDMFLPLWPEIKYNQTEKNNYPQNLMGLKHLFYKTLDYPHEKISFPFPENCQVDWYVNKIFQFPFSLFGVNFYGVLFMAIKWEEKPVDQTGAKTKNHYIAFL